MSDVTNNLQNWFSLRKISSAAGLCVLVMMTATSTFADEVNQEVPPTEPQAVKCESWLKRTSNRVVGGWRQFQQERREQGPIRFLLAPRRDGQKFNGLASFIDPFVSLPVETLSFARWRMLGRAPLQRRPSIFAALPAGVLGWTVIMGGIAYQTEQWSAEGLEKSIAGDDLGSVYVGQFVAGDAISSYDGMRLLESNRDGFVHGLEPLHERINQFQNLNLWTPDIATRMHAIVEHLRASHKPEELIHSRDLRRLLEEDPEYASLAATFAPVRDFTLKLLPEPSVEVRGKADAYWLALFFEPYRRGGFAPEQLKGLASLEKIYSFHAQDLPLPTLVQLVAETLTSPEGIATKIERATKLGIPLTHDFVYRADIPLFAQAEKFKDLNQTRALNDELDRWKLAFEDPRFAALRSAWEKGEISDLALLMKVEMTTRALSQVYDIYKQDGESLKPEHACELIFGSSKVPSNPLFARLQSLGKQIVIPEEKQKQLPLLRYRIANLYYTTFVQTAHVNGGGAFTSAYNNAVQQEADALAAALRGELPADAIAACEGPTK